MVAAVGVDVLPHPDAGTADLTHDLLDGDMRTVRIARDHHRDAGLDQGLREEAEHRLVAGAPVAAVQVEKNRLSMFVNLENFVFVVCV